MKKVNSIDDIKKGDLLYSKNHGIYWVNGVKDLMSLNPVSTEEFIDFEGSTVKEDAYIIGSSRKLHWYIRGKM